MMRRMKWRYSDFCEEQAGSRDECGTDWFSLGGDILILIQKCQHQFFLDIYTLISSALATILLIRRRAIKISNGLTKTVHIF